LANYKSYHTGIKTCYSLGLEKQILPESFTKTIPKSTAFYWKNDINISNKYIGGEFVSEIENNLDDVKILLDKKAAKIRVAFISFLRLYITIINYIGKDNFSKIIKDNRNTIVNFIENLPNEFPLSKRELLVIFKITPRMYDTWKRYQTYYCSKSLINLCFKRIPHQISNKEIETLKSYINNQKYKLWSLQSIWGKAIKEQAISMSRTTWYRYSKKLGLTETHKPLKKPRPRKSFDSKRPNQTWHMDV